MLDAASFDDWFFKYIGDDFESTNANLEVRQRFQKAMLNEFCDYIFSLTEDWQNFEQN